MDEAVVPPEKASTPASRPFSSGPAAPSRQRPTLRPFHKPADGHVAQDWSPFAWQKGRLSERCRLSSVQSSSSCSSPLGPVPVLVFCCFPKSILAKGYGPRPKSSSPAAAKQGSAKTCKSQTCPSQLPVSPSTLGSPSLRLSAFPHSAILKKTGVTCAWPLLFFFLVLPRELYAVAPLIETVSVGYPPSVLFPTHFSSLSLFAPSSTRYTHIRPRHSLPPLPLPSNISPLASSN